MCICINCNFYKSCWINTALLNYPSNYICFYNNWKNIYESSPFKNKKHLTIYLIPLLHLELNVNLTNTKREADIIFCDSFIENPGSWLK